MEKNIKKWIIKLLFMFSPKCRERILKTKSILNLRKKYFNQKELKKYIAEYKEFKDEVPIKNLDIWYKKFKELLKIDNNAMDFIRNFFEVKIFIEKKSNENIDLNDPIVVCVVKNDLIRMKLFLEYYRKLGIKRFAILDDNSIDGTKEYLTKQKDVDLFRSDKSYTTIIRQVWINRIVEVYGINRWYLILDSDELLSYLDMETKKIDEIIEILEKSKIERMRTFLLDMYSKDKIFGNQEDTSELVETKYSYFDVDNIYNLENIKFVCLAGGVRCRIFSDKNNDFKPYLTKYPLIKYKTEDIIINSHYMFPYYKNFSSHCFGVLRHFKFLNGDMKKYQERVKSKNFEKGSKQYQKYMELYENDKNYTFWNEKSVKWTGSNSLKEFGFVKEII